MLKHESILTLTMGDFLKCLIDENFSVLGHEIEDENYRFWQKILSQYYTASENRDVIDYVSAVRDANSALLSLKLVETLEICLNEMYVESACISLNKLYPQFTFSKETYKEDIKRLLGYKIADKIKYDNALKELEQTSVTSERILSKEQKYENYIRAMFDISKFEGVKYDMTMTVLEFAIASKRLTAYIEHMEKQARQNGN